MWLNSEIEALKPVILEQIFVVKKYLEEKHLSVRDCDYVESLKEEIKYLRAENQMKKRKRKKRNIYLNARILLWLQSLNHQREIRNLILPAKAPAANFCTM